MCLLHYRRLFQFAARFPFAHRVVPIPKTVFLFFFFADRSRSNRIGSDQIQNPESDTLGLGSGKNFESQLQVPLVPYTVRYFGITADTTDVKLFSLSEHSELTQ